ncbi:hypothetical protein [Isoptericola sp. BMS4]|uniref:hypothetical protein n=1 Tax=Isoptericola sp. BMS4 TaxID=2527875 RepID=UPI00141F0B21|nr:hypothetical protein [Isoptericola sp. BMS4]
MRRVLVVGLAVATIDGAMLGVAAALGWTLVALAAVVAGLVGAVAVAMSAPPPRRRTAARPSTVTLGLPLRDEDAAEQDDRDAIEPLPHPAGTPTPAPAAA